MTIFEVGDLVWMPFPFVEVPRLRRRPALVVSRRWDGGGFSLYWATMVTSVENAGWLDAIDLSANYSAIGLPSPCVIRPAKLASIMEETASFIGRLPAPLLSEVREAITGKLLA